MGNETKSNGASSLGGGGGGFRAKMEHYAYSGEKKYVLAGIGYSPSSSASLGILSESRIKQPPVSPRLHGKG
ncbi:unnamed protein product [Brassica napus]|nr:unnamed protein product [Brassica napus]